MKLFAFYSPKLPTPKDVFMSLIRLPKTFSAILKIYVLNLLPLILTQALQRFQDVVDSRMMSTLGHRALEIHNVQSNLYFIAQEIGFASAISALVFWRRKESLGKQGHILKLHLAMPICISIFLTCVIYFFLDRLGSHFHIPLDYYDTAHTYWILGLCNLVLRSIQIPLSAILIACDQRLKCILLNGGILLAKIGIDEFALRSFWNLKSDPQSILPPMIVLDVGSWIVLAIGTVVAIRWIIQYVDGWEKIPLKVLLKVWPAELGIAAVNSTALELFMLQLAHMKTFPGFFITYQLSLQFTYILALPVIAGIQIAVRDASAEHSNSENGNFIPLHESKWWPQFFYASLMPTCLFFAITACFSAPIFQFIYNYSIPKEHLVFMPVFFASWILWEWGDVYLIMLRAAKKNSIATRNFMFTTLGAELGITQFLLWKGWASPTTLSLMMIVFCTTYLILNRNSITHIQFKFFQLKARLQGLYIHKLKVYLHHHHPARYSKLSKINWASKLKLRS